MKTSKKDVSDGNGMLEGISKYILEINAVKLTLRD